MCVHKHESNIKLAIAHQTNLKRNAGDRLKANAAKRKAAKKAKSE
jgi:hypothetical protein